MVVRERERKKKSIELIHQKLADWEKEDFIHFSRDSKVEEDPGLWTLIKQVVRVKRFHGRGKKLLQAGGSKNSKSHDQL